MVDEAETKPLLEMIAELASVDSLAGGGRHLVEQLNGDPTTLTLPDARRVRDLWREFVQPRRTYLT